MAKNNIWIEDAQIITEFRDLSRYSNPYLLKTPDVSDFLSDQAVTSCAIVAPKGFGKTFILKLKRSSLQDEDYRCFPQGAIVDRPKDRPPILPVDITDLLEKSSIWETLWQISMILAVLKGYHDDDEAQQRLSILTQACRDCHTLHNILLHPHIDTPFDILHNCLSASRGELFEIIRLAQHFTRSFQRFHKKSALFIDNIDEYLQFYINYEYIGHGEVYSKYLRMWHCGQIGAWLSLRRLQGINPHVKIFISLRKESYQYAASVEPDFANLKSFQKELKYTRSDIRQIINNNIYGELNSNLVSPHSSDAIVKFVGEESAHISNSGTGKLELIAEYWLRHCSHRPRDAISIGRAISGIAVTERTTDKVRDAINTSAAERVQSLFTEVSPFFDGLYPELLHHVIKTNVLSHQELAAASEDYARLVAETHGVSSELSRHPFCALYSVGLIGVIEPNRNDMNTLSQSFARVGQVPFGRVGVLPKAEKYVIHPSLSDYLGAKDVTYFYRLNKHNIVGDGMEWRPEEEIRFVIYGDMKGFREQIMNKVGASQTFDKYWKDVFAQFTNRLDHAAPNGGDSILIADRDATRVVQAARALASQLLTSRYNLKLRLAGHSGYWRINHDKEGMAHPEISDIVGAASRMEPLAVPGHILLSEEFLSDAKRLDYTFDGAPPCLVDQSYVGTDRYDPRLGVLISKADSEAKQWMQMWWINGSN